MRALIFVLLVLTSLGCPAHADLVVSCRYFKAVGTSHYHLYLYRDDGKVVRQLTSPEDAHDTNPEFSPQGSEIVFMRAINGKFQTMSVKPDGTQLRTLSAGPPWYHPGTGGRGFGLTEGDNDDLWQARGEDHVLAVPDGKTELILKRADNYKAVEPSNYENICFKALAVRDLAARQDTRVPTGGDTDDLSCDFAMHENSPFLLRDNLRVAFFWQWLGSTDGNRLGVLDLDRRKAMFLSANPATAIPHGTRSGFFCVCQERYQPLPGTNKTVNCLYLDWWSAGLKRTRFARAVSLFGGASARVAGQPPLNIPKE